METAKMNSDDRAMVIWRRLKLHLDLMPRWERVLDSNKEVYDSLDDMDQEMWSYYLDGYQSGEIAAIQDRSPLEVDGKIEEVIARVKARITINGRGG